MSARDDAGKSRPMSTPTKTRNATAPLALLTILALLILACIPAPRSKKQRNWPLHPPSPIKGRYASDRAV